MTAMLPLGVNPDGIDTLLKFMHANNIDDDRIYSHLCPTASSRLARLLKCVERVSKAKYRPKAFNFNSEKSFRSAQGRLKGKIFEAVTTELLSSVSCFKTYTNIQTTTNEIDVLVEVGPTGLFAPALRDWGTHFVCECKFHESHVSTTWVGKLATLLQLHNAKVGLLISKKGIAPSGRGANIHHHIQMIGVSALQKIILPIDFSDIERCANGENILHMIVRRFIEARSAIAKFSVLSAP